MILSKTYSIFCTIMIAMLAMANYQNATFGSLFFGSQKAEKSANRYHK